MRKFLFVFGGIFLVLCVVVLVPLLMLYGRVQGFANRLQDLDNRYQALDQAFPYDIPRDSNLSPERFGVFVEVRQPVNQVLIASATSLREATGAAQSRNPMKAMEHFVDFIERAGDCHIESLRRREMSYSEYLRTARLFYATVIYAASAENPVARALRAALENQFRQTQEGSGDGEGKQGLDFDDFAREAGILPLGYSPENQSLLEAYQAPLLEQARLIILDEMLLEERVSGGSERGD